MNNRPHLWHEWIGRAEQRIDCVTAAPLTAFSATLDRDDPAPRPGDPLPPLAHWLYFTPLARASEIAWAQRVVAAAAHAEGAAVAVDGKMVDKPVLLRAQALLRQANRPS